MVYIKTKEGASLLVALLAAVIVAVTTTLLDVVWWMTLCAAAGVFVVMALVALFIIRKYVAYKLKPIYSIVLSRDVHTNEIFSELKDKHVENIGEELTAWADTNDKEIARLKETEQFRKQYLGNVAHELKTPIALIQGYAEGLKDNINDDEESREFYCDVIIDEAAKMNEMVKKLLNLNQLEFGEDQVNMERFDLNAVIKGVLQSSDILIRQKEAKVLFTGGDPLYVWGDEFKVEEVITNYLTNALNHLDYDHTIEITCKKEGNVVKTTVFNTGDPIPEEDLDKVWVKFFKVDKARTREYGGSGIGLSIVKAIMDSFQQQCGCQNYDNGVAFWFTLEADGKTEEA
jgi:signal transduction histidine kinase